ncbi:MAG TPA: 16S rRNA (guanine(966)-N(2))-methyltransferase RsmD [Stellaceae bacterium]|nr:16S rRNA (guanine(966)-N(2))-methyltransferase RsmD [Stellaceae bacterium]
MRVISGQHRGRRLEAPPGLAVRPTGERAREALFDILGHGRFGQAPLWQGARVLDAFAGTGAFGIEALSRGADHATFIDHDRIAEAAIRTNLARLGESERATLIRADATHPPRTTAPCSLAFLDPPYGGDLGLTSLLALAEAGWFASGALIVIELAKTQPFTAPDAFQWLEERRYGAAKFIFLSTSS